MKFSIGTIAKKYWKYALGAILVIGLGAYWFDGRGDSVGPTLAVTRGEFSKEISVSGTVTAAKDVDLGFAASGRIEGVYAGVGQHVYAGAILAETDNGDLAASVAQKQAALAQAQSKLDSLNAGTRPEEVAVAESAVESAQAALMTALQSAYTSADDAVHNRTDAFFSNPRTNPRLTFTVPDAILTMTVENDRAQMEAVLTAWSSSLASLTAENAAQYAKAAQGNLAQVSKLLADANAALNRALADQTTTTATLSSYATSLATARTNVNTSGTTLAANLTALDSAQKSLALKQAGSTTDDIAAQQAAVVAAQADVRNAQAAFGKTRVVAPFDGIVTRMDAKVGAIVSPSTSEISMQTDGLFQVETYVPEVAIADVAVGNPATTTLDAYGTSAPFPAKVVAVDPAETVKDGVPTYKVTLAFLAPDPRIRSGMTADVHIITGTVPDAVVIPAGAVGKSAAGSYVSVVADKKVTNRIVETKALALGKVQITSGLDAGETILVTPAPY